MLLSDSLLNIKTEGIRDQDLPYNALFYRTESTEYEALNCLFQYYQPLENPFWLDVGCGEGRILFSSHYIYQCPVIGVELNNYTYQQLHLNRYNYLKAHPSGIPIHLENTYMHEYPLDKQINTIYLFNPFAPAIFKQFIYQLLDSFYQHWREIDLILYYPSVKYINILEETGVFSHKQSIPFDMEQEERLRFEIFNLS